MQGLVNRLILKLVFKPSTTPFVHVGQESFREAVLRVLRVYGSTTYYIIPGSSLKGVLRRISENVAKCSLSSVRDPLERILIRAHCEPKLVRHSCYAEEDLQIIREYIRSIISDESIRRKYLADDVADYVVTKFKEGCDVRSLPELEPILAYKCPICRLYGGPGLKGKIVFKDVLIPQDRVGTALVSRVALERVSRRARESALFTVELLVLNDFCVDLVVENIVPGTTEALILAGTLSWLRSIGIGVGGMKSVGVGHYLLDLSKSKALLMNYQGRSPGEGSDRLTLVDRLVRPYKYLDREGVSVPDIIEALKGA